MGIEDDAMDLVSPERPGFEFEDFATLFDYWSGLRNGTSIPGPRDFDLLDVCGMLPDLVLSEVISPDEILVRFMGPSIVERFGYDPTGRNSLLNQTEDMRAFVGRCYWSVVDRPCGAFSRFTNVYSSGRESIAEGLYLPLLSDKSRWLVNLNRVVRFSDWQESGPMTLTAARILDLDWIDLGFGVPSMPASAAS